MTDGPVGTLGLAFRIGLARQQDFAREFHERLVLHALNVIPTQWLSPDEVCNWVEQEYQGLRISTVVAREALVRLQGSGLCRSDVTDVAGSRRFTLTPNGQNQCADAHREGDRLLAAVKTEFLTSVSIQDPVEAERRWDAMSLELDAFLAREALNVARVFLGRDAMSSLVHPPDKAGTPSATAKNDAGLFLQGRSPDRREYLARALHGAIAINLFRASSTANEEVLEHLRGRTFYLDTTVLYTLVADGGPLGEIRTDFVRAMTQLDCRLRVSSETLREFLDSVKHYKDLTLRHGIHDPAVVRVLISERDLEELDDFRRGYYYSLTAGEIVDLDTYASRYELIEQRFTEWKIPRPESLPTKPVRTQDGTIWTLPDVEEYDDALKEYLRAHPRKKRTDNDQLWERLVMHDATHVAFVQHIRNNSESRMPAVPSQVRTWFLTRDRKLCDWDREFIDSAGIGSVPRCMGLEEWIEAVDVFLPSMTGATSLVGTALRMLSTRSPKLRAESELDIDDLEQIGRVARQLELTPAETSRVAADQVLRQALSGVSERIERIGAIREGAMREKNRQLEEALSKLAQARASNNLDVDEKRELTERIEELRREVQALKQSDVAQSAASRKQLFRGLAAVIVTITLVLIALAYIPSVWTEASGPRRLLVGAFVLCVVPVAFLHFYGMHEHRGRVVKWALAALALVVTLIQLLIWTAPKSRTAPSPTRPESVTTSDPTGQANVRPTGAVPAESSEKKAPR